MGEKWKTQSQEDAGEQMGRNGGVPRQHIQIPSIVRGTCLEARVVQESLWKLLETTPTPTTKFLFLPWKTQPPIPTCHSIHTATLDLLLVLLPPPLKSLKEI